MTCNLDVTVIGSLHLDIMIEGAPLPRLDETVMGTSWHFKCGGKGGNQAVAAAQFKARTAMIGRVGNDDFGRRLLNNLDRAGVDRRRVVTDAKVGSGMSVALVDAQGGYGAAVVSGANLNIETSQWDGLAAKVLVLQNEIPAVINAAAAQRFSAAGTYIVHNCAPFRQPQLQTADLVIANRIEASQYTGMEIAGVEDLLRAAGRIAGMKDAVVTAGAMGCAVAARSGARQFIPPHEVQAISSHGAGDCFTGAMAAHLAEGGDLVSAARFASVAAALFVSSSPEKPAILHPAAVYAAMKEMR
jgi:ribokinase